MLINLLLLFSNLFLAVLSDLNYDPFFYVASQPSAAGFTASSYQTSPPTGLYTPTTGQYPSQVRMFFCCAYDRKKVGKANFTLCN